MFNLSPSESSGPNKAIIRLLTKSFIHNKNITDNNKNEYWKKIREWYENIYKVRENRPHLDAITQCDELKIIFDFDSEEVGNVDPLAKGSHGVAYPSKKWIIIGAKYLDEHDNPDESRESFIKSIFARESDHYALELNYENNSKPYLKHDEDRRQKFEKIVQELNVWKSLSSSDPYDECDGMISSVFKLYSTAYYHSELIVRVPQILTRYAGEKKKLDIIEKKYKPLFDYYRNFILDDLRKFNLRERKQIRDFNKLFGKLSEIQECKYEFSNLKDIRHLLSNYETIASTYVPLLLLLNIQSFLSSKYGNLLNTKCIFIDSEYLKNGDIVKKLQEVMTYSSQLNIVVDCTKGYDENFKSLINSQGVKFTFVVSDDQNSDNLAIAMKNNNMKSISYKWNDLSSKTQDVLLETKANLLNDPVQIRELLTFKNKNSELEKDILDGFSDNGQTGSGETYLHLPSGELFKALIEKSEINIKESPPEDEKDEKNFNMLFLERDFIKYQMIIDYSKTNDKNSEYFQESTQSENAMENDKISPKQDSEIDTESKIKIIETKMILEEFLRDVANKRIIVLADSAGTGKSWAIKKLVRIMRKQSPRKWTILVDLKQFIECFKKTSEAVVSFSEFIINSILRLKTNIEKELFSRLYENGKTCIFFDGFDEIVPNYAEFVKKLFKSYEPNGGNQLWIATKNNFEIDLLKELKLDVVYKLEPFTQDDGINLMTSVLILNDLKTKNELKSENDIQTQVKNHPDYEAYKKKAADLNKIVGDLNIAAIGFPQFYQMTAEIFINKGSELSAVTATQLFQEFVNILFKRWAFEKGEIRNRASISSQLYNLNFIGLHQYFAMKASYPDTNTKRFCDLVFDVKEWPESEIIACGLLVLKSGKFQFHYETFREFFIAQFMIKLLKRDKENVSKEFCKYLCDVLTLPKFEVVRVFFNESLIEYKGDMQKILSKIDSAINNWGFLLDIYKNNLKNLQNMWINYFKSLDYDKMKNILTSDKNTIFEIAENKDLCEKFQKFPHALLNPQDLNEMFLIKNEDGNNFLHHAVIYNQYDDIKTLIETHKMIFEGGHFERILKSKGDHGRNLLQTAVIAQKDVKTFEYLWNIFQELLNSAEKFLGFLKEADDEGSNIFNLAATFGTAENFKFLIEMLKTLPSRPKIKEFLDSKGCCKRNLLQAAARHNKSLQFHEGLWSIMREYFDLNEILKMIKYTDKFGDNLLHNAVGGDSIEIIELTWREITVTVNSCKKIQNKSKELEKILKSKGDNGRNLLQTAVIVPKDFETFKYLWRIFQNAFNSSETFLTFLKEVDGKGSNILNLTATFGTSEIFEHLIEMLKKLTSRPKIKKFLSGVGFSKRNLLQAAARHNTSNKLHKYLWMIMREYFDSDEILEMIIYTDGDKNNLLHNAVNGGNAEIIELTWNEITATVNSCNKIQNKSSKLEEILKSRSDHKRNSLQTTAIDLEDVKNFEHLSNILQNMKLK